MALNNRTPQGSRNQGFGNQGFGNPARRPVRTTQVTPPPSNPAPQAAANSAGAGHVGSAQIEEVKAKIIAWFWSPQAIVPIALVLVVSLMKGWFAIQDFRNNAAEMAVQPAWSCVSVTGYPGKAPWTEPEPDGRYSLHFYLAIRTSEVGTALRDCPTDGTCGPRAHEKLHSVAVEALKIRRHVLRLAYEQYGDVGVQTVRARLWSNADREMIREILARDSKSQLNLTRHPSERAHLDLLKKSMIDGEPVCVTPLTTPPKK